MKTLVTKLLECRYKEGDDGFMVQTLVPDILTISRTRGELIFTQVEHSSRKHVVVFGWIEKCEHLSSGKVKVTVSPLNQLQKEVLLLPIQEMAEGTVNFW